MRKREEKEFVLENVALLLESGMDMITALEAVRKSIRSKAIRKKIREMRHLVEAGSPFWQALKKTDFFSPHVVSLAKVGEESGHLPENLRVIVLQQYKDRDLRSRLRSAALYPVFMFALTGVIGISLAWFLLPRLTTIFLQLKVSLPLPTQALIWFGDFLQHYGVIVVPLTAASIFGAVYFLFINHKTQYVGKSILFHIYGIKGLIQQLELARLGFVLGTLLEAGMPLPDALSSLTDATPFRAYGKLYRYLYNRLIEGHALHGSMARYPGIEHLMPPTVQEMVGVGEQSGKLVETLLQMGRAYESKAEITTKNLTIIFEPVLLFSVWFGVVFVALAVILPIYGLVGNISQ